MIHNILYLTYDGLTDPLGQSQILPYVIGLSKSGYRFTVISFEKRTAFAISSERIQNLCSENKIEWVPLAYHKSPPIFSTLYDLWNLWREVAKNHRSKKFSLIHCRSYITSLIALRAKRKWGVKFIFDMRGFWADERVEGGLWNLKNPVFKLVYSFFKKKEKQFLTESEQVVSLTHNAKEEIESWKIENAPITVIPTCVDLNLFDSKKIKQADQDSLRSQLGIRQDDFVLLYLGSWGTWYLTEDMLNFFSLLKQAKKEAKFLIVSPDKIDVRNYKDVIVTAATRKQVPLLISLAQVSICFVKPTFSKKASFATKLAEVMAMNVPVIVNRGWGDIDYLAQQMKDETPLTDFVDNTDSKYCVLDLTNLIGEQFSLDSGIKKYIAVYEKLK